MPVLTIFTESSGLEGHLHPRSQHRRHGLNHHSERLVLLRQLCDACILLTDTHQQSVLHALSVHDRPLVDNTMCVTTKGLLDANRCVMRHTDLGMRLPTANHLLYVDGTWT